MPDMKLVTALLEAVRERDEARRDADRLAHALKTVIGQSDRFTFAYNDAKVALRDYYKLSESDLKLVEQPKEAL